VLTVALDFFICLAVAVSILLGRTLLLPNGDRYIGGVRFNQPHGHGIEYRADGSQSSGQWCDGELHGRGKEIDCSGGIYEGDFQNSRRVGLGQYVSTASGHVYQGEFKNGALSGFGIQWDKDGKLLMCGRWAGDKPLESRPVPHSKILFGTHLSAAGQSSPHLPMSSRAAFGMSAA